MDIDSILPKNSKLVSNIVFYKRIVWIPLFEIKDNYINLFFNLTSKKELIKLIKNLLKTDIKFFLVSPLLSDPSYKKVETTYINELNLRNALINYITFFDDFREIEFNFIENLCMYCTQNESYDLLKDIFDSVNSDVQGKDYDFYTNKKVFLIRREDIRDDFATIYRQIQLYQILL